MQVEKYGAIIFEEYHQGFQNAGLMNLFSAQKKTQAKQMAVESITFIDYLDFFLMRSKNTPSIVTQNLS